MTETPPSASSPLPDIGSALRQARLRRGASLEAVFQQTRIPKKYLEAMESNRFEELPAPVYLMGFLKNYCDHLEVEFGPLWEQIAPKPSPKPAAADAAAEPATVKRAAAQDEDGSSGFQFPAMNAALLPILAVALAVLGWLVWTMLGSIPPQAPPPAPKPPAPITPIRGADKMLLKIVFKREAWVRLLSDGALRFEGRAPAGFTQEWPASGEFVLRTSREDDLGLTLDGKDLHLDPSLKRPSGDYRIAR